MKRDFIHDLYSSFVLWFDHFLLDKGEAHSPVTNGQLYYMKDANQPSSVIFGSPHKQWVYDASIEGVVIPSSVSVNNTNTPRGSNGLKIDFQNGRAIFDNASTTATVKASYSVKDFNVYTTTKTDAELIFETRYAVNPTMPQIATGILTDKLVAPCIFLKLKGFNNEELAFGGQEITKVNMRAIVLADSEYMLNGVGNIFVDASRSNFLILDSTPLNRYGDLKSGSYNYDTIITQQFSQDKLAYIQNVSFNKMNHEAVNDAHPDLFVGFIDFNVEVSRWPRL